MSSDKIKTETQAPPQNPAQWMEDRIARIKAQLMKMQKPTK